MKLSKLNQRPEIFYSIQGEGKTTGKLSIFIRFSGCNLQCSWCDSATTWNFKKYSREDNQIEIDCSNVVKKCLSLSKRCFNVIFTGGEPLLWQQEIVNIIKLFKNINKAYTFEIETNGTITICKELKDFDVLLNCSPKLENSGNSIEKRHNQTVLKEVNALNSQFKFVVNNQKDLSEIRRIIKNNNLDKDKVYLMPQGKTELEVVSKSKEIIQICLKEGYNFSSRLQVLLWGEKRGV